MNTTEAQIAYCPYAAPNTHKRTRKHTHFEGIGEYGLTDKSKGARKRTSHDPLCVCLKLCKSLESKAFHKRHKHAGTLTYNKSPEGNAAASRRAAVASDPRTPGSAPQPPVPPPLRNLPGDRTPVFHPGSKNSGEVWCENAWRADGVLDADRCPETGAASGLCVCPDAREMAWPCLLRMFGDFTRPDDPRREIRGAVKTMTATGHGFGMTPAIVPGFPAARDGFPNVRG